ncbi:trans-aconitate 2-methyltransferase [Actinomadura macrotermitis]|uniref:Trans-aconitate 2-methyltransferase n=1 Tax=Actinomadura macrotermitis TaxID=2585200 RepID=A0A7K0BSA6_9ACTN|nr:trans-aconitate 2-methyltransferase [Actinomadura macrotermitis]MQY04027.1 putative trans-aconitate 2-methyltransferase [Actinomadura macrotermitis]
MSRQAAAVWDPAQYGAYAAERGRPFADLLNRVRIPHARRIADLGCGSGELTATLAGRWPGARVDALDSSPEMIEAARAHATANLRFTVGDVTTWRPDGGYDLIVSNAVLHWVPGHTDLLPRWIDALEPGGVLAFQVPGNFDAPSHTLLRDLCESQRWRDCLSGLVRRDPVLDPAGYLDLLTAHGCAVDAWETTYAQLLHGDDPVLAWVKGTALRPVLSALDPADTTGFLTAYAALLREAYPAAPHGTVFPFRRVFVVAGRP